MGFMGGVFALAVFVVAIYFVSLAISTGETINWIIAVAFGLVGLVIIAKAGARA